MEITVFWRRWIYDFLPERFVFNQNTCDLWEMAFVGYCHFWSSKIDLYKGWFFTKSVTSPGFCSKKKWWWNFGLQLYGMFQKFPHEKLTETDDFFWVRLRNLGFKGTKNRRSSWKFETPEVSKRFFPGERGRVRIIDRFWSHKCFASSGDVLFLSHKQRTKLQQTARKLAKNGKDPTTGERFFPWKIQHFCW